MPCEVVDRDDPLVELPVGGAVGQRRRRVAVALERHHRDIAVGDDAGEALSVRDVVESDAHGTLLVECGSEYASDVTTPPPRCRPTYRTSPTLMT